MHKILLIIRREYLTRVKKRSFIIMTILGPVLIGALYGVMIYLAVNSGIGEKVKTIAVHDEQGFFKDKLQNDDKNIFIFTNENIDTLKSQVLYKKYDALIIIPKTDSITYIKDIDFVAEQQPGVAIINKLEEKFEEIITNIKMKTMNLTQAQIKATRTSIAVYPKLVSEKGTEDASTGSSFIGAMVLTYIIFLFIMLYGIQVMRGVIEEKTSRIVEIMISSVKPFQLMMGKIIGIACVALTQFAIWIVLTITVTGVLKSYMTSNVDMNQVEQVMKKNSHVQTDDYEKAEQMQSLMKFEKAISTLNFPLILFCFVFYFITGYLLYASLYAAIGSAVDSETDTQQFMLPVNLPLIFSFFIAFSTVMNDPNGSLAFWASIIPFSSPIVMMARVSFMQSFNWEIALSMGVMLVSFVCIVWFAARIYRVGILMYGKKPTFRELGKWVFYR